MGQLAFLTGHRLIGVKSRRVLDSSWFEGRRNSIFGYLYIDERLGQPRPRCFSHCSPPPSPPPAYDRNDLHSGMPRYGLKSAAPPFPAARAPESQTHPPWSSRALELQSARIRNTRADDLIGRPFADVPVPGREMSIGHHLDDHTLAVPGGVSLARRVGTEGEIQRPRQSRCGTSG
ncbi:hypothetical protein HO173_001213 [Letharia columbiana]|uniref:Uncharacterized protein n=1 Tax=Letharia columbiana TaxID=112416 RepID=A0A8H6G522_9LECA|nr:uncharacterized protein HO173_001213 [Letharia columbiana]KAF6240545.1 hypothetical protein HO173_001213 [Letharia columbiana]